MRIGAQGKRVLICAPFGRDAELAASVLANAGLDCVICRDIEQVVGELETGAGALLTVEDAIAPKRSGRLDEFIAQQAAWSDLPVLVLTKAADDGHWSKSAYRRLRNLTLLESPIRPSTLVSAVRAAIRARERQYEVFEMDQRKDEFLAMLGHELRNPLAPIGAAALLLDLAATDVEKVRSTSKIIARQVKHMTSLIDDLLDVARVTRGLITLDREIMDIRLILTEAIEQVEPLVRERGHAFKVDMPQHSVTIEGDHKRLVQVFANVLHNAVKYTPNGGAIDVACSLQNQEVVVVVSDNGVGMNPEVVERVFDLFAQAERSADRSQGGLGLGLSIVESLVRSHGGNVYAASEGLSKGSVFTIRLPLHERQEIISRSDTTAPGSASPHALRAMVVDDNKDAADMLAMLLEARGFEVSVHYTARAALEHARSTQPHVFLLDIGLPEMNGNELARELRRRPEHTSAVLFAVTGYGQQKDIDESMHAGFNLHFVKPINIPLLFQKLSELLGSDISSAQRNIRR